MKKVLLTLTAILTLASCQDKFEQIDANFLYQQEQIEAIKQNLEDAVNDLQSQLDDTNSKLDSDITALTNYVDAGISDQNDVNEFLFLLIDDLFVADAEIKTYVTELDAIQAELINANVDAIDDLKASQESIEADLNALFSDLEATFVSKFDALAVTTQNGIANALSAINFDRFTTAWEVYVDNSTTTNVTEITTGTASSSTMSGTMMEDDSDDDDTTTSALGTFYDDLTPGNQLVIDGVTITRSSVTSRISYSKAGDTTKTFSPDITGDRDNFIETLNNYING